jgi:two-component system, LuxR family, response regulator FixJ
MDMAVAPEDKLEIIIVDDDEAVRNALVFAFQIDGFDVRAFGSGEQILAASDLPRRGCLIMDQRLPGIDGLEVVARLRARGVDLPALLITTPTTSIQRKAKAADIDIVEKPMLTALVDRVRILIGQVH